MQTAYSRRTEALPLSAPQLIGLLRETLARGGAFRFQATGGSMSPFIRDGDVISIVALGSRAPSPGAVVAFQRPTPSMARPYMAPTCMVPPSAAVGAGDAAPRLVVHRVVKVSTRGCFFLGDNQPAPEIEGPVARENLLGVVVRVERSGRPVRFGLGIERGAIAIAARAGLLLPCVRAAARLRRAIQKIIQLAAGNP